MSCSLFVAEVRGSRKCSVCRCDISAHDPTAIFVQPHRIFSTAPPFVNTSLSASASFSRMPTVHRADTSFNSISSIPKQPTNSSLSPSENSAFTVYARPQISSLSDHRSNGDHVVLRPEPRLAVPLILPRQEGSDSNISKKIRTKRRERPRSVGLLDLGPSIFASSEEEGERRVPEQRSHDFQKILKRFQSADKKNSPRMTPPHGTTSSWSTPHKIGGSQDSWNHALPPHHPHRGSLNSNLMDSPANSRNTSARSRLSVSSAQSPHCYLPTRESSPRSIPIPSMVPMRPDSSPDITINELHHSPLSHTGSTPEPTKTKAQPIRRSSYTAGFHQPHTDIYGTRWVKETDVDDPLSIPMMSPVGSSGSSCDAHLVALRSAPLSKVPSMEKIDGSRNNSRLYNNRNCRRSVFSGTPNQGANGVYVRRSRSKDDRPSLSYLSNYMDSQRISPPRTTSIPAFMSQESIAQTSSIIHSPINSPIQSIHNIVQTGKSQQNIASDEMYKHYQQMALSHVHTLNVVADKLSEESRRGEEPVSRNRLAQLDFTSFVVTSPHPILTKGKSLFYNAVLPRQGLPDYLVTLMIAPCSQYAPLMRKTESNHFGLPGFLEIEDHEGSIKQFLYDTGTQNLDGRNVKVIAMPRLNLCSFHSLAAHQLNQRLDRTHHEELVSFILLQLLQALKMLQGEGVESLSTNFKEFLLAYRYQNISSTFEFPRLLFLPETLGAEIEIGGDELVGLCRYALRALCTLLHHKMDGKAPVIKLRSRFSRALSACAILLQEDKSNSLTKAKNVLELALWSSGEHFKNEQDARVWIDTARAECVDTMLRQLISEPGRSLGARERFRVEFLLAATPRSIMESQRATLAANVD
ncbi:unnamed protein product [Caenorhabditis bovis]|uniref:Uncharacterized protein n=1 Tax=Caenorhabditis bovis TaxID=2654633 RepID=A0A8S1EDH1_9PELO|nr:unnamed protein product [Caenorhabditis bovis]